MPGLVGRIPQNQSGLPVMTWHHLDDDEVNAIFEALEVHQWIQQLITAGVRGSFAIVWQIRVAGRGSVHMAQSPLLF